MMFDLTGRKAIVTGGNRGLGRAIAEAYHEQGAEIVIISTTDACKRAASEIAADGGAPAHGVVCDLSDRESLRQGFDEALKLLGGRLDILFNNAGINRNHKSQDFPLEDWDVIRKINYDAVFLMSQLAAKVMMEQKYGRIINMASLLSIIGGRMSLGYAAAKGGVVQMTKAMSNDWAPYGITVNCIAPGYMNTDMNKDYCADLSRSGHLLARIPVGRWGVERDLRAASVFLASEEADYVTGILLPVDGGFLAW
ncbi:SDR family NAD(P)-dependent oxidoreductase [Anaerotruncus colihominis]|uniref:SDR family oxidoreductase n=1 Tax=Anaerotruncus colihominis TaxID=169435 RepID=A0A845SUP4_9FIRM|nr:SDR family oxidoreductase [Anaerotruncus colihominis]MCR2024758.1 SDR family oxidoreductase [Anaerotruncus colihominis]NDO38180.1 SDR family oxidoreductase [Anaerotruncus colihominis]